MIHFESDNKVLRVKINDGVGADWHFDHTMNHKSEAIICSNHFQKELESKIKSIRRKAYEDGYKDGKHHQKKIKEFCGWINHKITGWK